MDNIQIQDKAGYYLNLFEQIRKRVMDVPLSMVILQEIGKDIRQERIGTREYSNGNGDSPATDKQIGYMRKLGIPVPENLTKREASRLIDGARDGNGGNGDNGAWNADMEGEAPTKWPRRIP
jgi:hypothetical protein